MKFGIVTKLCDELGHVFNEAITKIVLSVAQASVPVNNMKLFKRFKKWNQTPN